jgi:hypothetical protein
MDGAIKSAPCIGTSTIASNGNRIDRQRTPTGTAAARRVPTASA